MFNVVIGNPPYQNVNSSILYDKYILEIKDLKPDIFSFIVPSSWITGSAANFKEIRKYLLGKNRLRVLCDYVNSKDVFPIIKLDCGINYFLYDKFHKGKCLTTTNIFGNSYTTDRLLDSRFPIRFAEAATIVDKVRNAKDFFSFSSLVKSNPFSIDKNYIDNERKSVTLYKSYKRVQRISANSVTAGNQYISKWKVFISKTYGDLDFPRRILPNPILGSPNSVCSKSYLFIGPFSSEEESLNVIQYMKTRFFRFLILMLKSQQFIRPSIFTFVPVQDFNVNLTDHILYDKYKLNKKEISFIKSLIRPMGKGKEFKFESGYVNK